jgi:hypothetical protein
VLVNLYKSKTPQSVFTLPIVIGLVCLSLFFKTPEQRVYFFEWQTYFFGEITSIQWLNYFLTGGLISLNAHQLNNVFNRNSFFSKDTFLPGFIYLTGLVAFKSLDFSAPLVAHLFLIGALSQLLQLKRQEAAKDIIFKGSFLVGLATIFSPLSITLCVLPWIALLLIKPFIWREWVMAVLGMALPIAYHHVIYYLNSGEILMINIPAKSETPDATLKLIEGLTYAATAICIVIGLFKFLLIIKSQIVNFKKLSQVVLWMGILTGISFTVSIYFFDEFYLSFLLPISFIISIQLLNAGRVTLANGFVLGWFIISVVNLYL